MAIKTKSNGIAHTLLEQKDIFEMLYPVGSIYLCKSGEVPADNANWEKLQCPLAQYGGTWQLVDFSFATTFNTCYVINNSANSIIDGNNIDLYNSNGSFAQRWRLGLWRYNFLSGTKETYPDKADEKHGYLLTWVRIE